MWLGLWPSLAQEVAWQLCLLFSFLFHQTTPQATQANRPHAPHGTVWACSLSRQPVEWSGVMSDSEYSTSNLSEPPRPEEGWISEYTRWIYVFLWNYIWQHYLMSGWSLQYELFRPKGRYRYLVSKIFFCQKKGDILPLRFCVANFQKIFTPPPGAGFT